MAQYKILMFFFFFVLFVPSGQSSYVPSNYVFDATPPVEKITPVERNKKKKAERKRKKRLKRIQKNSQNYPEPEDLGNPALAFWLIFAIASILIALFGAFVIGLGMAPWVVAFYLMLGAELAAFAILISVIWIDKPGDPAIVQFTLALFALIAVNVVIGLSFIIWALVIGWVFGWIIGLILLALAGIFLAVHLILANKK